MSDDAPDKGAVPDGRTPPSLDWLDDGTPVSAAHNDIYFQPEKALAEIAHVYLSGNDLPDAWAGRDHFTIGEAGFGAGLNFLCAADLFLRTAPEHARLDYFSVEGFPMLRAQAARAHARFPGLADLSMRLLAGWPGPWPGFHRIHLHPRIRLTLMHGEVAAMLARATARVDAWFMDGFAPAKNPDMWRDDVIDQIARLSAPGATLASFTAAGTVRRGLEARGFCVARMPGFGNKRQMIKARIEAPSQANTRPGLFTAPQQTPPRSVLVIGGGIAGCASAHALTQRGVAVTILEAGEGLAARASGNPAGIIMPRAGVELNAMAAFHEQAFGYTTRLLNALDGTEFDLCGVRQMAGDAGEAARFEKIAAARNMPADQLVHEGDALVFPSGGWVVPASFCNALAHGAEIVTGAHVTALERLGDGWRAQTGAGSFTADAVVIACANDAAGLLPENLVPLEPKRGQVTLAECEHPPGQVLSCGSYLIPLPDGRACIGATFDHTDDSGPQAARADDDARNIQAAMKAFPHAGRMEAITGRASLRATTPDRMPVAGPVVDADSFRQAFGPLARGGWSSGWRGDSPDVPVIPGLWVLTGLGSRGLVTAPLAAETLAAQMLDQPLPVAADVADALSPARFIFRVMKRSGLYSDTHYQKSL